MRKTVEYNLGDGQKAIVHYDVNNVAKITKQLMEQLIVDNRRLRMIQKVINITERQEQTDEFQAEAYRRIHAFMNMEFLSDCEVTD